MRIRAPMSASKNRYTYLTVAFLVLLPSISYLRSNNVASSSPPGSYKPLPPSALENMPLTGVQITRILTNNTFTYAFLAHDDDSYQVKDEAIRALEPGLSALWVNDLKSCCAAGGTVLDIGSHFGYYALLGHSLGCKFIAIEPVPLFRSVLEFNLFLNNVEGTVYPYALGTKSGELSMSVPKHGVLGTAHVVSEADKAATEADSNFEVVTVKQSRLDELVDPLNMPDVCMMKIDVEGFEPAITLSAKKLLETKRIRNIMMEFSPGYTTEGLLDMLTLFNEIGYNAVEVPWHLAKMHAAIPDIKSEDVLKVDQIVILESKGTRQAFIDKVTPVFNTNLWLTLPKDKLQ